MGQRHGNRALLLLTLYKVKGCNILHHSLVKGLSEHPRAYELELCFMGLTVKENLREYQGWRVTWVIPWSGTPGVKSNRKS